MELEQRAHETLSLAQDQSAEKQHLRSFWQFWSANSLSNLGDGLYQFTLPLLAVQLTSEPAQVAGVTIALTLAWPLFALQAGSIVDRVDRRRLMLAVNLVRIMLLLGLTAAMLTGHGSLLLLYSVALLLGIGETLMDTALTAVVPSVVPLERLSWANGRITAAQTITNSFIGPPLAGYLAGYGLALATGVGAALYIAAAPALALMRGSFRAAPASSAQPPVPSRFWSHVTEGIRFLWQHRLIRTLTLLTAAMNVFWGGWTAVLVLYAVAPGPMGLSTFGYGLLLTTMAVGGVLGSLLCEPLQRRIGSRAALALDLIGTAALLGVPALSTNAFAVGAATCLAGFGAGVWVVLVASLRQRIVPGALLGRVYSASRMISWGVAPLGAALAGLLAALWDVRAVFALGGTLSLALLVIFLAVVRPEMLVQADAAPPDMKEG